MRGLSGKTAVVTGGATVIGQAVVGAFAEAQTNVAVADIDIAGGEALAAELGDRVLFAPTDLRSDEQIAAFVGRTVDRFGGIDFLVNLACSYAGAVMMAQAVHPHLVAGGGGAIVNFTSISSKVAQTGRWLYPTTKAALVQVTRNMALDLAGDGIRVNSVSPGWTWSKIMVELSGDDRAKTDRVAAPFHLLGRVGDPDEVAQVALFLCSDNASFVTGADYAVDGGYSAMGPEQAEGAIPKLAE